MEAAGLAISGVGLVLSAAQTLLASLQSHELKEICSLWGYDSDLEQLQHTVNTINSVLLDAETKGLLSHQQSNFIQRLKDAVYKADDLLDEFNAYAEQHHHQLIKEGKVSKKIRRLFSRFGELGIARQLSKNVKKIREELDAIASDASKFCFKVDYEPIRTRREETCSYVHEKNVVGREKETEEIINMLLPTDVSDPSPKRDVPVLAIVGMGGMGKTTLAQHVFNQDKVQNGFQLRLWVCLSDENPAQFSVESTLVKILASATGKKQHDSTYDDVQRRVRDLLQGKKYLLVLDDVWTEDRNRWREVEDFLLGGARGSQIMVTTRSEGTCRAVGCNNPYKLQGLSDESCWSLFEMLAFDGREGEDHHELVKIGKSIVKKCTNVPLPIRVVGGLLYRQGKEKWLQIEQHGLHTLTTEENSIMWTLKLSYIHLLPSLKSCFSYCAIFPKDFFIRKERIISLWMAQGYVLPLRERQSIEDASEEYFLILLRRCFFQVAAKDDFGEIVYFKMHDLMHDLAQEVARNDICMVDSSVSSLDKRIRHVSHYVKFDCPENLFSKIDIRTYLRWSNGFSNKGRCSHVGILLTNWLCLRVLDLHGSGLGSLPEDIGKLSHLRYLDVSENPHLVILPESITRLHFLEAVKAYECGIKELPKSFSKLAQLRLLEVNDTNLTFMPSGMDKLTCLCRLDVFIVSEKVSGSKQYVSDLKDLRALNDLKGHLTVKVKRNYAYVKEGGKEGGYLENKEHLNDICILFEGEVDGDEVLLENLRPHCNVKKLKLEGYQGVSIPGWAREENLQSNLANLVEIHIQFCHGIQKLASFGGLEHLKSFYVYRCHNLEYIGNSTSYLELAEAPFFPSLKKLSLVHLPKLRGWKSGVMSFHCLSDLMINGCPNLISIPLCPTVETLYLEKFSEMLQIMEEKKEGKASTSCVGASSSSSSIWNPLPTYEINDRPSSKFKKVTINDENSARFLNSLPKTAFGHLEEMSIERDKKMESMSEIVEVLYHSSSSLRKLNLRRLSKLRSICGGGLKHLIHLETLRLRDLARLISINIEEEEGGEDENEEAWRCLAGCLRYLDLCDLPKVVKLPKGMQHLTSLTTLRIWNLNLEGLPEWISCLSSLQSLVILSCKRIESLPVSMGQLTSLTQLYIGNCSEKLKQRYQSPNGEDWPLIHHIPNICMDFKWIQGTRDDSLL